MARLAFRFDALAKHIGMDAARREAGWMLQALNVVPPSMVSGAALERMPLAECTMQTLSRWLAERKDGKPLQYILQDQPFCGLNLLVRPPVLIPRPETEEIVAWFLDIMQVAIGQSTWKSLDFFRTARRSARKDMGCSTQDMQRGNDNIKLAFSMALTSGVSSTADAPYGRPLVVVDLCTGSGAIALALAARLRRDADKSGAVGGDCASADAPGPSPHARLPNTRNRHCVYEGMLAIGVDISPAAVTLAMENARHCGLSSKQSDGDGDDGDGDGDDDDVRFMIGDIRSPAAWENVRMTINTMMMKRMRVGDHQQHALSTQAEAPAASSSSHHHHPHHRSYADIIISNPPYIPASDFPSLDASVRCYEDANALIAPDDGMALHKAIIRHANTLLPPLEQSLPVRCNALGDIMVASDGSTAVSNGNHHHQHSTNTSMNPNTSTSSSMSSSITELSLTPVYFVDSAAEAASSSSSFCESRIGLPELVMEIGSHSQWQRLLPVLAHHGFVAQLHYDTAGRARWIAARRVLPHERLLSI